MSVRKEPAIENENATYFWSTRRLPTLGALKSASQVLRDDNRGKIEGDQRCGLDGLIPPDGLDEIGAFGGGIGIVLGLVAIAHTDIFDEELRHFGGIRQVWQNLRPSKGAIGKSRHERNGVRGFPLPPQEYLEGRTFRGNDSWNSGIIADAFTTGEPSFGRRACVHGRIGDGTKAILHIVSPDQSAFAQSRLVPACQLGDRAENRRRRVSRLFATIAITASRGFLC
jgi:hypothetical protein